MTYALTSNNRIVKYDSGNNFFTAIHSFNTTLSNNAQIFTYSSNRIVVSDKSSTTAQIYAFEYSLNVT